jgi:hypothetical protein
MAGEAGEGAEEGLLYQVLGGLALGQTPGEGPHDIDVRQGGVDELLVRAHFVGTPMPMETPPPTI